MNIKRVVLVFLAVYILALLSFFLLIGNTAGTQIDLSDANAIVKNVSRNWDDVKAGHKPDYATDLKYAVYDSNGNAIFVTNSDLNMHLNDAIRDRYIIMDIMKDDKLVGKIGFPNDIQEVLRAGRDRLFIGAVCFLIILAGGCAAYTIYIYRKVIAPFNKMQSFAARVAQGNLDVPLEMDRGNLFGAFTESFDLMREELYRARENERAPERSKKELVASISHDIKTPISTIKATTEVMQAESNNDRDRELLTVIEEKTGQIDLLITNMFHTTLEELQELKVTAAEETSTAIYDIIHAADYDRKIKSFSLPECIVLADPVRLLQVFDNIIGNTYKYAGTDIEIESGFDDDYLIIKIRDFGSGVPDDDLPMIFNKFYRGTNAEGKSGYGLGLFISKNLINQMQGDLNCKNLVDGFSVTVSLKLASNNNKS